MSTPAVQQFNDAVTLMVSRLSSFLPVAAAAAPQSTLALLEAAERPVGVGAFAGNVERGPLAVLGVRGGRVEARARFDLRGADPAAVADAALQLQQRVREARANPPGPWMRNFVVLEPAGGDPATLIAAGDWRQGVEYRVLYEYRYEDAEESGGLIVRIPVELRGEQHEDALVTRDLARWSADEAPPLRIRGPRPIGTLTALTYASGAVPAGPVTLRCAGAGAVGARVHGSLDDFASAVVDGGRDDQVVFADVGAFLAEFAGAGDDVMLADGHGTRAAYRPRALRGPPAVPHAPPPAVARLAEVRLAGPDEVLEVSYRNPALDADQPQHFAAGSEWVVYLRAGRGPSA